MPIQLSGSLVITGSITTTGVIIMSGSIASASYSSTSELLQGTGSVGFTTTASFNAVSSSQQQISASYIALSASYNTFSGSASTRITANSSSIQQVSSSQQQISSSQQQISASLLNVISIFATTGSNSFRANQSITGSLVVSSTITAQTLVVQTVTSSIVYSSGSNIFGSDLNSRQTFTGSIYQTGSIAGFSGCVGIGTNVPSYLLHVNSPAPSILLESNCSTGPAYLRFNNTARSNTNYIALGGTSNDLFFTINGADRFFISGSGNVGIGTQTPNRLLSIQGPAESWIESITTQPTTQCWIFGQDGARKGFEVYDLNQSATRLFVAPTTGNVGICNTCPRSPLSFSNGTGDKIDFYNDNIARYSVQVNSGELRFYTCGTDRISLYAGNTVGLVNRSGKIVIGGTCTDALFSVGDWCNRAGRLLTSNCAGWAVDGVTPCAIITSNTTSTCLAQVIGLALHNDSQTTNTYTPAIAFSRRSYSGNYNSAIATIQAQATGCGVDSNWVAGDLVFSTNPINAYMGESMRLTSSGGLGIGTTSVTGTTRLRVINSSAVNGCPLFFSDNGVYNAIGLYAAGADAYNGAVTVMIMGRNTTNCRSINAGGTINASGADYAEYMRKATEDAIAKGDIVGVNLQGKLTNIFEDSISFVVKSTDPSYVGGDTWGSVDNIGKLSTEATQEEKTAYNIKLEEERAKVDRISFSGQVPCNITGANVGDYIIPIELENGKIGGQAVTIPTLEQYRISVGKVWKIMEDGRAWIAVKIG